MSMHFCEINDEMLEMIGFDEILKEKNQLISGRTVIFITKATVDNGKIIIAENTTPEVIVNSEVQNDEFSFVGNKTVLVIKVNAKDTETTSSAARISDEIFGTAGDKVNLKSQMSECSMNKLNFIPFNGTTPNGKIIENGVGNIFLSSNLKNAYDTKKENEILDAVKKKYGKLKGLVDHLMIVLPKGAGDFYARAYVFGWLTVYNDEYALYPSISMHEIGHNMGLDHSGTGNDAYGDYTGVLGYGNMIDDDKKCFNAVKSWDFGWYADGHKLINPFKDTFEGRIVGIANFDERDGMPVLIKIVGHDDGNDRYIAFNRKYGMNLGSTENADQVIVTLKKSSKRIDLPSYKEVALSSGGRYSINNFGGSGLTLILKVNKISTQNFPAYADISILLQKKKKKKKEKNKKNKKAKQNKR